MEGILSRLQRWRHSRGFGVHSPFAFRFITETLHQPYAYYAYSRLAQQRQRLLYRVTLAFGTRNPLAAGLDKPLVEALRLAARRKGPKGAHDFIALDATAADSAAIVDAARRIADGTPAIIYNSHRFPTADTLGALKHGMTFANTAGTIIIAPLPHLPRQDFRLNF